jgi:galactose mutarotase-like enzyme
MKQFPFSFNAIQKIGIEKDSARIALEIQNTGSQVMPVAP